jgi:hypothetical protein
MTRQRSLLAALAAALLLSGCSGSGGAGGPVDAPKAREVLKIVLDGWKRGDTPATFAGASPAVTVQDMDWSSGAKLVDYQVAADGKEMGSSLYVPVALTLRPKQGPEAKKNVTYIVNTSPILTVFRGLH